MASPISFQGLSTNLPTDQLVNAILQQESAGLTRMQDRQTLNNQRGSALRSIRSALQAFSTSLGSLTSSAFLARAVASSDANGTYVTASASDAATGTYQVVVGQIATAAKLDNAGFAVADATATKVFDDSSTATASFALRGVDGTIKTLSLTGAANNLNGLRDAINAAGAGVSAVVVNSGTGAKPYRLVLTATATGTGTTAGAITLAETTSGGALNSLGIAAGAVDNPTTPTTLTGGTSSSGAQLAVDAQFTVNGIALTRQTNTVTDAVSGITFNLRKGDGTGTVTTLTVSVDKAAITAAANDVVAKFNAAYSAYQKAAAQGQPLAHDGLLRGIFAQIRSAFMAVPAGVTAGSDYSSAPALGFKTNKDGTFGLDAATLQSAIDANLPQVAKVLGGAQTAVSAAVDTVASPGSGSIAQLLSGIDFQNLNLSRQISSTQTRLDRRRQMLMDQYANLEAVIGQLQAAGQSLGGLR